MAGEIERVPDSGILDLGDRLTHKPVDIRVEECYLENDMKQQE